MRGRVGLGTVAALAFTAASAGMSTTVSLRSQDPSLPKLGLPSVRVVFQGHGPAALDTLKEGLAADVLRLSQVRDVDREESPDYLIVVRFLETEAPSLSDVLFEATLLTHDGRVAWIADGRTVREGEADPAAWRTIGRNVLSALFRDGWLEPKYDPNDPPPETPIVRRPGR